MFQAYFVYSILLLFLLPSIWMYSKSNEKTRSFVLFVIMLFFSLVIGLRYNVGTDYMPYKDIYIMQYFPDVESGFALMNRILYWLGLPFSSIFILVAFLQLYFFVKGVESINKKYLPLAIFFYFTTLYLFLSLNVLRQTLAFSILVYSIKFIVEKKIFKYVLTIFLASTLHKSALVLLPLYFIINNDWLLKHRIVQLGVYILTFSFSLFFHDFIISNSNTVFYLVGYGSYASNIDTLAEVSWAKEGGLGVYFFMILDVWLIWYFTKFKNVLTNKSVICFYNLYFLGIIFANIIQGTYFERMNIYFQHMRIIIYAVFFYNIFLYDKSMLKKTLAFVLLAIFIIFFYMGIYNKASMCAPYQFV